MDYIIAGLASVWPLCLSDLCASETGALLRTLYMTSQGVLQIVVYFAVLLCVDEASRFLHGARV